MLASRLQVLTQYNPVTTDLPQVCQGRQNLALRLTKTHQDRRFGDDVRAHALGSRQHIQRTVVVGLRANRGIQSRYGLDVVSQYTRTHGQYVAQVAKIGNQRLDCEFGKTRPDRANHRRPVTRPAVGQVVARHRRQHQITQLHTASGFGDSLALRRIERLR